MIKFNRLFLVIFVVLLSILNLHADEIKIFASDGDINHYFGTSVEIDGNLILAGAPGTLNDGDYKGAVYTFEYDAIDQIWIEKQKLEIPDDDPLLDLFGFSLAFRDSFLIVGAMGNSARNPLAGAAYIFKHNRDNSWTPVQKLVTSQLFPLDQFGFSVQINKDFAVVGAPRAGGRLPMSGSVYVYHRDGDAWTLDSKLFGSPGATYDNFGVSIALADSELVVGASGYGDDQNIAQRQQSVGKAYVFKRDKSGWLQSAYLSPADGNVGNLFGCAVALDDDYAAIGACGDDVLDFDDGSVYLYKRHEPGWEQELKLTALDADSGDCFGKTVGLQNDYLVIGAPGVNGWGANTGAVYSFLRGDEGWTQRAKKTAYDASPHDSFGFSVAVSNDFSVIGTPLKSVEQHTKQGVAYIYDNIADLALPVELTSFTATSVENGVLLHWLTQSEKDNLGFIVQRRTETEEWQTIASFQTHDALRGQGSTSMPTYYEFLDDSISFDQSYQYRLADVDYNGVISWHEPIHFSVSSNITFEDDSAPTTFTLFPAYPNPFNPQTVISYQLPAASEINIHIVDVTGRHVRRLVAEHQSAGVHSVMWDGRNDAGHRQSSGVYFILVQSNELQRTQKVILMQ